MPSQSRTSGVNVPVVPLNSAIMPRITNTKKASAATQMTTNTALKTKISINYPPEIALLITASSA